ncbi:MAG: hypothetical protein Q4C70_11675, partial [Planctomycetia bacterium]|nr:hypothetical protein [Planctomycetia bacterium]
ITNFTTNPERREAIRELLQKEKEMETLTVKQLKEKQLARMDEMQPVILEKLVSKLNENEVTLEI